MPMQIDTSALLRDHSDRLASTVENNSWHVAQSVMDHATATFEAARRLETLVDEPDLQQHVARFLRAVPAHCQRTRMDLLRAAALLHDIGKPQTLRRLPDGTTSCPQHAKVGAELLRGQRESLRAHGLTASDCEYVIDIVQRHHDMDAFVEANDDATQVLQRHHFLKGSGELAGDLMLFYLADLEGCRMAASEEEKNGARIARVQSVLSQLLQE